MNDVKPLDKNSNLDTKLLPWRESALSVAIGSVVRSAPPTLSDWYPIRLKVELLHQNGPQANPLGAEFDYKAKFEKLDFNALKKEIKTF